MNDKLSNQQGFPKIDYRIVDLDYNSDGETQNILQRLGERGWDVVKVFEPRKYINADNDNHLCMRVILKKQENLLDYFAGKALAGIMSIHAPSDHAADANYAYEVAEAMLKERERHLK